uniref:mRNA splicing factor DIB1 n=1 Tax=Lotharella oceanica TaxID=641309 RepID=A0A7S2TUJ5_9EUKA|mmetsp:Transcript_27703/g.51647  ORF Transcript_27703/g.51647 Transcript_27703/m.51647 type:complete len:129 (+) Transcript_27703:1315-1701(+)
MKLFIKKKNRLVIIRFGIPDKIECKRMDKILEKVMLSVYDIAIICTVDIEKVVDFNEMYELYDNCSVMFFFRNRHIMIDLGTGNNNKIDWVLQDKFELIDIIESVYRGVRKGKNLILSPIDFSKKYRF